MSIAFIGLGSNLSQPVRQIKTALRALAQLPDGQLLTFSSLYRSTPLNCMAQPDYINAVAKISTALSPQALLQALQQIECSQGRVRGEHWAARTLDLDLLLFDELQQHDAVLTLPHPGLTQREFVVFPLLELVPDLVLPDGTTLQHWATPLMHKPLERLHA
jgi:2-amino-4-hydroxy-6-hydroxymethyldihydropteridine diphosphokinase